MFAFDFIEKNNQNMNFLYPATLINALTSQHTIDEEREYLISAYKFVCSTRSDVNYAAALYSLRRNSTFIYPLLVQNSSGYSKRFFFFDRTTRNQVVTGVSKRMSAEKPFRFDREWAEPIRDLYDGPTVAEATAMLDKDHVEKIVSEICEGGPPPSTPVKAIRPPQPPRDCTFCH